MKVVIKVAPNKEKELRSTIKTDWSGREVADLIHARKNVENRILIFMCKFVKKLGTKFKTLLEKRSEMKLTWGKI